MWVWQRYVISCSSHSRSWQAEQAISPGSFLSRRVALWQRKLFQCSGALFISDGNLYNFYNHFMALFIVKRQKTCAKLILQLILIHDLGGNYFASCESVGEEGKSWVESYAGLLKMTGVLMNQEIWPSDTFSLPPPPRERARGE
jgi:hypothetical protein